MKKLLVFLPRVNFVHKKVCRRLQRGTGRLSIIIFYVLLFSITRSSSGRKPSARKYLNGKQEGGTSNRGNSLVIYLITARLSLFIEFLERFYGPVHLEGMGG